MSSSQPLTSCVHQPSSPTSRQPSSPASPQPSSPTSRQMRILKKKISMHHSNVKLHNRIPQKVWSSTQTRRIRFKPLPEPQGAPRSNPAHPTDPRRPIRQETNPHPSRPSLFKLDQIETGRFRFRQYYAYKEYKIGLIVRYRSFLIPKPILHC